MSGGYSRMICKGQSTGKKSSNVQPETRLHMYKLLEDQKSMEYSMYCQLKTFCSSFPVGNLNYACCMQLA